MFNKIVSWIKQFGARQAIHEMDKLEPIFAAKIREAQQKLGAVSPDEFAKLLVDEVQLKLCGYFDVDPATVLSSEELKNLGRK